MTQLYHGMHLALFLSGTGSHMNAWRQIGAAYGPEDFDHYRRLAEQAEAAKLDLVFLADSPAAIPGAGDQTKLEAATLLAGLTAVTSRIGLVGTMSTSYCEPYNVARVMGTLDHMTGGRAGWNVVTTATPNAAANFGKNEAAKAERYERASEFLQVVKGLWDSWQDDSTLLDRTSGQIMDMSRLHPLNHRGKHFQVAGPLNLSRSPQGHPVIFQAGASEVGIPFAATTGEVIFTVQDNIDDARAFADRIRDLAANAGRDPKSIKILEGIAPFVADSEGAAREMLWGMSEGIDEPSAWAKLRTRLGVEVEHLDPEGPIPEIPWKEMRGYAKTLTSVAKRHGFNLRQLRDYAVAAGGHRLVFGSAAQIADDMEAWYRAGAVDGFVIMPPALPGPWDRFRTEVIPILQKRRLFRHEYSGATLREHLGLKRPLHPMAQEEMPLEGDLYV